MDRDSPAVNKSTTKKTSGHGVDDGFLGKGAVDLSESQKDLQENGHSQEAPGVNAGVEHVSSKGVASQEDTLQGDSSSMREAESSGTLALNSDITGYVFIQTVDGDIEKVEKDVAQLSPFILREVNRHGRGYGRDNPVVLPKQVSPAVLKLILDYCRFHQVSGRSDKERKIFDEKFIRLDTRVLCELTSAADSLDMKMLVDLTSRALARMIEGKTPEEIRETFHLPDDLTEEEKLEPVKNSTDDPRIRLLNRLYARKRKELQDKKMIKDVQDGANSKKDNRSVEALLQFIDGGAGAKKSKKKKKKKGKKDEPDEQASEEGSGRDAVAGPPEETDDVSFEAEEPVSPHGYPVSSSQRAGGSRGHSRLGSWLGKSGGQDGLLPEQEGDTDEAGGGTRDAAESPRTAYSSQWTERMQEILALASSSRDQHQASQEGGQMPPPPAPPARRKTPPAEARIQAKLRTIQELHEQLRLGSSSEHASEGEDGPGSSTEGGEEKSDDGSPDVVVAAAAAAAEAAAAAAAAAREAAARCRSGGAESSGGGQKSEGKIGGVETGPRLGRQSSLGSERDPGEQVPETGGERSWSVDAAQQQSGTSRGGPDQQEVSHVVQDPRRKGAATGGTDVEPGLAAHNRVENGSEARRPHQQWSGIALLEAQQTAAFLGAFLRRVGFDSIVDVGMRGEVPAVELEDDHVAEQWAPDGNQMSMCVRLASGSIVSLAVAKPAHGGRGDPRGNDR